MSRPPTCLHAHRQRRRQRDRHVYRRLRRRYAGEFLAGRFDRSDQCHAALQDNALVNDGTANVTRLINDANNDGVGENFMGADGFGSLVFSGGTNGAQLQSDAATPLTAGGLPIFVFGGARARSPRRPTRPTPTRPRWCSPRPSRRARASARRAPIRSTSTSRSTTAQASCSTTSRPPRRARIRDRPRL